MTVCQICGDKGYSKLLIKCVQCQNIAVHRYCVLNPFFCEDEVINWSCEFCDPCTTEPTARKSEGLASTVEQVAVQKPDREKPKNNSSPPQSKKTNVSLQETAKEAADLFILDQKNKDGSVKSKQVKLKETGSLVIPSVAGATDIGKADNSNNDVDGCEQELPQSEGLTSTVEQEAVQKPDGKKAKTKLSSPQSKKPNVSMKETAKETTDLSILDQKNEDGSVKGKQVKLKEKGSPVLPHVSDATDIEKGDNSNNDVDGCKQELPESEGLVSTVEQVAVQKPDRKKLENSTSPPQSEKPNVSPKETVEEATDLSSLDQKNEDGSGKSKQVKLKEKRSPVLPHVSDAIDIEKGDNSNNDVDGCEQELPESEGLISTVEQVAVQKPDRKKLENSTSPPQSEKPNISPKETVEEATDLSSLDQKNEDGSVKSKQVKLKEKGSPELPHVSDATDIEKGDSSNNDVDGCEQELPESEGLISTVEQVAVPKPDRKKPKNNTSAPQSEKPNVSLKETLKEATDLSILDQKNKDGSVKNKQVKLKEKESHVLPHVSDATEVVSATDIEKRGNSSNDVNESKHELSKGGKHPRQLTRSADAKKGKKNKDSISDNGLKKGNSDADKVNEQKIKSVNLSDATAPQQPKLQQNLGSQKFTEEATDLSILDQKNKDGSVKRKQLKLKERGNPVLLHASETTEVVPATDMEKGNDSNNDVNECIHELQQGGKRPGQLKPSADAKMEKKIEDSISDNGVSKGRSDAVQLKKQKIKNVDSSDLTGDEQLKRQNNLGSQKLKDCSSPKKTDHTDVIPCNAVEKGSGANKLNKSSSKVYSDQSKELPTNKKKPRDAELNDHDSTKKSGVVETVVDCALDQPADVQSNRDVSESKAPRKKRKLVIEMEYSDEDPVFVVSKHPQLVANVRKESSSHSSSEAVSKLSDGGLAQLSSIESIPHQPSPMNVDNRRLTRQSSVVFENHIPSQPPPLTTVNYVPAQPLIDAAWRGYCNIADEFPPKSLVLEAHLSNKAHEKVQGAVSVLPELLNFVFVPKKYAWPKTYEISPPTADEIGLYFFPVDERAEKLYCGLVNKMAEFDLVLKSVINNLELLVFCSVELPREAWSFRRKYYLWSVFRRRKDPIMPNKQEHGIHQKHSRDFDVSYRGDYSRSPRKFREPQDPGHHHDTEISDHAEQNHDHRGRSDRWDKRSRKSKGRDWKDSGRSPKTSRSNNSVLIT